MLQQLSRDSSASHFLSYPNELYLFFPHCLCIKFCIKPSAKSLNLQRLAFLWHLSVIHSSPVQRPSGGARGHSTEGATLSVWLVVKMFQPTAQNPTSCEDENMFGHFFCRCFSDRSSPTSRVWSIFHSTQAFRERSSEWSWAVWSIQGRD